MKWAALLLCLAGCSVPAEEAITQDLMDCVASILELDSVTPPVVIYLDREVLGQMQTNRRHTLGFYRPGTAYMIDGADLGIRAHEAAHHLQYLLGLPYDEGQAEHVQRLAPLVCPHL